MTPISKTTDVPLTPQDAFDLFIAEMDLWWPKDSHSQFGPDACLVVESRKGGLIKEVANDGREAIWGRIIAFDRGSYLAFTWSPDGDEDNAAIVAVAFTATADGTRLDLTHGGYEVLGPTADAVSTSYLFGWDLVLGSYAFTARKSTALRELVH